VLGVVCYVQGCHGTRVVQPCGPTGLVVAARAHLWLFGVRALCHAGWRLLEMPKRVRGA